jgi:hypothetical protein
MNQTERTQHTRGPWRINERDESSWRIFGPDRGEGLWADEIAEVSYTGGNAEANARLIASAPRLLAALFSLVRKVDPEWVEAQEAEAAIAEAKGQ